MVTKSVSDLAVAARQHLRRKKVASPGVSALKQFFEIIYLASLKTEEGRPLQLRVALVDPNRRVFMANPFFSSVYCLFALFFVLPSFVFSNLQPLFRKHPGGGMVHACVGAACIAD